MASQQEKKKERPSALRSIIAGSTAGAVEIGKKYSAPPQSTW
jgi:solute carrier family 25 citrate transporter 1